MNFAPINGSLLRVNISQLRKDIRLHLFLAPLVKPVIC